MATWAPIADIARDVKAGKVKAVDLVETALKTIEDKKDFQAVISTTAEQARKRAKQIDASPAGMLAGVPFIAKDNFLVYGPDTTAASNILKGFKAPYQATVIERLEAEGAICVAKSNLDAFAHGSSTENSDFFTTKNPHDKTRVPGGSSGGSAAAVMLGMVPFALGTDTGGSIRQPASLTGAVGYKPTYGLVSRSGIVAMASSTDCPGPLTRTVADAAVVLDAIAGKDPRDSTSIDRDETSYIPEAYEVKGKKIGVVSEYMNNEGLDPGVKKLVESSIDKLKEAGAEITEVSLPSLPLALAVYYVVVPAEVSSNLSRYDGQRYGHFDSGASDLQSSYLSAREQGFGKEAKRRIIIGTYVLSSGYYDAYYKRAQAVRTKLIDEFNQAFSEVDFLIGPTAPGTAFKIGENTQDPLKMYLNDIMTVGANLTGVPSVSIPCGEIDGLPVGLQLMSAQREDRRLLMLAKQTEELLR
jgi:aspartyl-tRNA(Asn)/glutamyl-tRNA(Gln) amidotransferase subunit A